MSGGSLDLEGNNPVLVLTLNGSGVIGNGASGAANEALFAVTNGGMFSGTIQDGGFGGDAPVALAVVGGTLVLSGTNTFSGGTTVYSGTLEVTNGQALPEGSSLTVGADGTFVFDPTAGAAPLSAESAAGIAQAVPEPGTLTLLGVAGVVAVAAAVRRKRSRSGA